MIEALVGVLALALALYAVLGGADFGGGILDLLANGRDRARQRRAIAAAMGPVWEANHVWLIFAVILSFTVFPRAFAIANEALILPLGVALLGIVLRGAAFAFRAYGGHEWGFRRLPGVVFGVASLVAPVGLGAAAGALAAGRIRVVDGHAHLSGASAWCNPLSLVCAAMAVTGCGFLAATFMAVESRGAADAGLEETFRRRGLRFGFAMSLLAPAGVLVTRAVQPHVWSGLVGRGAPLVALSALGGGAALAALARRRYRWVRLFAGLAIAAVLGGWIVAQWPLLIVPDVTVGASAAPEAVQRQTLTALAGGALLLAPSLWLLYRVFRREGRA